MRIFISPFTQQCLPHQMFMEETVHEDEIVNQILSGQGGNCGLCSNHERSKMSLQFCFPKKILKVVISYDSQ